MVSWIPSRVAVPISPTALVPIQLTRLEPNDFDLGPYVVGADPELAEPGE